MSIKVLRMFTNEVKTKQQHVNKKDADVGGDVEASIIGYVIVDHGNNFFHQASHRVPITTTALATPPPPNCFYPPTLDDPSWA